MAKYRQGDGFVYQGSPKDLISMISREIVDTLNKGGVQASPVHALAMLHVAASLVKEVRASTNMGKAPSFRSILSVVMRGIDGTSWTDDEIRAFDEDFCQIIESLGGERISAQKNKGAIFVSPSLGVQ